MRRKPDIADEVSSIGAILVMLALASLARMPIVEREEDSKVSQPMVQTRPFLRISVEAQRLRDGKPMRINRANEDDLVLLPGVGAAKAKAIVAYRTTHGAFRNANDLTGVSGLGVRSVAKLRDLIVFE